MSKELEQFKEENNVKHVSEFNNAIAEIIRKEPTPFIYERLGERYHHFLIDEFQDTSVVQWHNLLPLVHNSLSEGYQNLIVVMLSSLYTDGEGGRTICAVARTYFSI